jgi:hypothetical protein
MPHRNYSRAQSSQSMPQFHLEEAELRSPPSPHQLARLRRIRRRSTHRYLEHRLEAAESMFKMTPTYVIVLNPNAASDFLIRAAIFALRGRIAKLGEPGFKRNRREGGTLQRRKFGLRRYRVALVIFVRVRLVGTWQERFNSLLEHIMPQHSTTAHTWQIA